MYFAVMKKKDIRHGELIWNRHPLSHPKKTKNNLCDLSTMFVIGKCHGVAFRMFNIRRNTSRRMLTCSLLCKHAILYEYSHFIANAQNIKEVFESSISG